MKKLSKFVFAALLLAIGYISALVFQPVRIEDAPEVFRLVGHMAGNKIKDAEFLFYDNTNDVAYYRHTVDHYVKEDDVVYLEDDSESKITGLDTYGFYIEAQSSCVPGMSGTSIRDENGNTIGYIAQILNKNVYCIWS